MANSKDVVGKTSTGFEFSIKKSMLNNAEFLECYSKIQNGDNLKMFELMDIAFGEDQKKDLYDHIRDEDGIVPMDVLGEELTEIFDVLGKAQETKN